MGKVRSDCELLICYPIMKNDPGENELAAWQRYQPLKPK